jgi:DnaJ-class molecular chaperone
MPRRDRIDDSDATVRCTRCGGTGQVRDLMDPTIVLVCPQCKGAGRVSRSGRRAAEGPSEATPASSVEDLFAQGLDDE